jgi:Ca2+-dependent lipid-binding protein
MPGKVKVKIVAGRNLPVMDRSADTTDAYVEIKLGTTTFKTDVCRKSLNPQWSSEWYRFEVKYFCIYGKFSIIVLYSTSL